MVSYTPQLVRDLLVTLTYVLLAGVIFGVAEGVKRELVRSGWRFLARVDENELARKLAHVLCSLAVAGLPLTGASELAGVFIGIVIFFVLLVGARFFVRAEVLAFLFLKRQGSTLFAVSLIIMSVFFYEDSGIFQLAFLVLAFADPAAAIIGIAYGERRWLAKTVLGSCAHCAVAFAVLALFLTRSYGAMGLVLALLVAAVVSLVELVSTKGLDNILVPVATALSLTVAGFYF